ncbi:hypothetical protein F4810DRAFT_682408 [Camillea tinctor]|nr:hypothetical protein F4810DRAFT_682408 [Camillea tinctor]
MHASSILSTLGLLAALSSTSAAWTLYGFNKEKCDEDKSSVATFKAEGADLSGCQEISFFYPRHGPDAEKIDTKSFRAESLRDHTKLLFYKSPTCESSDDESFKPSINKKCQDFDHKWKGFKIVVD